MSEEQRTFRPLYGRMFVKRRKIRQVGSIIIPEESREIKPDIGVIVAVGSGCGILIPGITIMFGKYAGKELDLRDFEISNLPFDIDRDGEEIIVLNEEDALGIWETQREFEERRKREEGASGE